MKRFLHRAKLHMATLAIALLTLMAPLAVVSGVSAAATSASKQAVCDGAGLSAAECSGSSSGLNNLVKAILNVLSAVVGVVAVVMIIVSGFRYITSGGDAAKVGSAKSALIYALVGLVVVALAQVIVHFVFAKAT